MDDLTDCMDENEDELRRRGGAALAGDGVKLSRRHRLILRALRDHLSDRGAVRASIADLMRWCPSLSQTSVSFGRQDLRIWGYIEVAARGGGRTPPAWRICLPDDHPAWRSVLAETEAEFLARAGIRP